jgi:uncharacterized alpha-E superfamily protein
VAELLVLREELPRSLIASIEVAVAQLTRIGQRTGTQGEADRIARRQRNQMRSIDAEMLVQGGLHEYLQQFVAQLATLDRAIAQQFRFA